MAGFTIENETIHVPTVMCIDDDNVQLSVYRQYLSGYGFDLELVSDPYAALDKLKSEEPDLILLDLTMPNMNGFVFMEAVRNIAKNRQLPIIVVSGYSSDDYVVQAYNQGAIDFIRKPFVKDELVSHVRQQIESTLLKKVSSVHIGSLESYLKNQLEEIKNIKNATIFSLAKIAESRDPETGEHLERIREYAKVLAEELSKASEYASWINNEFIYNIYNMSALHDIGKVGIPDHILLKPGKLTTEEYEVMKTHTTIGGKALEATAKLNNNSAFLEMGMEIAYYHHERWNGGGYPSGLKGDDIPLAARITTVADVYDALSFKRVYRDYAYKPEEIDDLMVKESGQMFDPEVIRVYERVKDKFLAIKKVFS